MYATSQSLTHSPRPKYGYPLARYMNLARQGFHVGHGGDLNGNGKLAHPLRCKERRPMDGSMGASKAVILLVRVRDEM